MTYHSCIKYLTDKNTQSMQHNNKSFFETFPEYIQYIDIANLKNFIDFFNEIPVGNISIKFIKMKLDHKYQKSSIENGYLFSP